MPFSRIEDRWWTTVQVAPVVPGLLLRGWV